MAADLDNVVGAAPIEPASPPNQQVSGQPAAGHRTLAAAGRVYLPTLVIAGCAAWLAWHGWTVLSDYGPARSIRAGQFELAGPAVLGFVLVVFLIEQIRPAERRAVWARGHLLDLVHLLAYATLVVPLIVLTGAGFSSALARVAPWLVLPHVSAIPSWCFVAPGVLAIDAVDWLTHLGNHLIPILAIASNATTPAVVLTTYACLGALPHANVRWTYRNRA